MDRLTHLRNLCKKQKIDAFLLSTNTNIFYISGFSAFLTNDHDGFCFVTEKNVYLLTTPLYTEAVKRYAPDVILRETTHKKWYKELLEEIMQEEKIDTIGFEPHDLRFSEYHEFSQAKLHLVPLQLTTLRIQKDVDEIKNIQKACDLTDATFAYILKHIKEGMSEKQVAWEMEKYIKEKGGELAFPTIVAFGENSALIHHLTTDRKLEKNEFILLDFGAKWQQYCSDMSRTIYFGTPNKEQEKMHQTVKRAQEKAIEYIGSQLSVHSSQRKETTNDKQITNTRVTIFCKDVDQVARNVIKKEGYQSYPHSLGHGIGLDIHEAPSLSEYSKDILKPRMVFTIEPGMYIPGTGGVRIEDMFVLEESGIKQLTQSPKELIVI